MTMSQFKVRFQELSRYATAILSFEEKIHYFVQWLSLQLKMGTYKLVTLGHSFLDIIDHARSLEQISHETQRGSDKRDRCEGEFSGS